MPDLPPRIFAQGLFWNKPHENAPKSLKGKMSIQVEKFMKFIQDNAQHKSEKGWITVNLWKSEEKGTYYFDLDTWKPKPKTVDGQEIKEDIPF